MTPNRNFFYLFRGVHTLSTAMYSNPRRQQRSSPSTSSRHRGNVRSSGRSPAPTSSGRRARSPRRNVSPPARGDRAAISRSPISSAMSVGGGDSSDEHDRSSVDDRSSSAYSPSAHRPPLACVTPSPRHQDDTSVTTPLLDAIKLSVPIMHHIRPVPAVSMTIGGVEPPLRSPSIEATISSCCSLVLCTA